MCHHYHHHHHQRVATTNKKTRHNKQRVDSRPRSRRRFDASQMCATCRRSSVALWRFVLTGLIFTSVVPVYVKKMREAAPRQEIRRIELDREGQERHRQLQLERHRREQGRRAEERAQVQAKKAIGSRGRTLREMWMA
jgi:hypothetical protein